MRASPRRRVARPRPSAGGASISEPLVGIGLPTHNGERYIREALDALLAQDYPNFRLVISDNASTDRTGEICLDAARRDARITYRRSDENLGAARNFNQVFDWTSGPYFMWAADDDRWDPSFVRRCVSALEGDRSAVMVTTGLRFIDESGNVIEVDYGIYDNPDLSSRSVARRAAALVRRGGWYGSYGLARRDALGRTGLFQDVYGPDVVLVMELALQGPILKIPEILFWYRQFETRTEVARATRQGRISNETRVLQAKYTYLQESLSAVVRSAPLATSVKVKIEADILRAAYLETTPLSGHTKGEVATRARHAAADLDLRAFAKFAPLTAFVVARRWWRRLQGRTVSRLR